MDARSPGRWRREVLWVGLGQLVATVGIVAGVRFLTTNLDPHQYGELAVGLTAAVLVNQLLIGPLTSSFVRFFAPAREGAGMAAYLAAIRRLAGFFAMGSVVAVVLFLFVGWFAPSHWVLVAVPAVCFSALSGAEQSLDGIQNAARQRSIVAFHLALGAWGRLLAAYGLFRWFGPSSTNALWGYAGATALLLVSQSYFFRRRIASLAERGSSSSLEERRAWTGRMLAFSQPFAVWGVFHWALLVSDRYALGLFRDAGIVGLYNVVYQIGYYPIVMLSAVTMQVLVPILYNMAGDASDQERLHRSKTLALRLAFGFAVSALLAAAVAGVVHQPLFDLLVGPNFRSASYLLPYMLLAAGLFTAAQIAGQSPLLELDARKLLVPKLVTTSAGVLLNLVGAYFYGIEGVVGAGVVFSLFYFLWMMWLVGRGVGPLSPPSTDMESVDEQLAGPSVTSAQFL